MTDPDKRTDKPGLNIRFEDAHLPPPGATPWTRAIESMGRHINANQRATADTAQMFHDLLAHAVGLMKQMDWDIQSLQSTLERQRRLHSRK